MSQHQNLKALKQNCLSTPLYDSNSNLGFPSSPSTSYLPCATKDIQTFILRRPKYMRAIDQFNEDEVLPSRLLNQFFKGVKHVKQLRALNLKWSHVAKKHTNPEVVKSVFKRHCQTLKKYDVMVLRPMMPYHYKNLHTVLKNPITASMDNNRDIRKLLSLKTVQNLRMDLRSDKTNFKSLYQVLGRLACLRNLNITCLPECFNEVLQMLNELSASKQQQLKFEIFVGGQQDQSEIPHLQTDISEKITQMSFQYVSPGVLLDSLFRENMTIFSTLKVLKLEFSDISASATSYFGFIQELASLEKFTFILGQSNDEEVAAGVITSLRLPLSLQTLELNMPLHLNSLLTHTKKFCQRTGSARDPFPWRNRNVFEEEPAFAPFFQTLADAKNLKTIICDFYMLETFKPYHTNFLVSILARLPNIVGIEMQISDNGIISKGRKGKYHGCFDLQPFFKVCSTMPKVEQIDILMPNLIFEDAELNPITNCLRSLTVGVNEKDEDKPIKFSDIEKPVERLLKTLARKCPNLSTLCLDFAETVDQTKLVKRFGMIQKFINLEALGVRYFVGECSKETAQDIGKVIKSLGKLNTALLKFLETDKTIYEIENYIKYHRSLRNILIQFNDCAWMDNECLINPLGVDIRETKIEEEGDNNNNGGNINANVNNGARNGMLIEN